MGTLLKQERQLRILDALHADGRVRVSDLSLLFGISEVTVRRDLAELAASGQLVRAHRGALAAAAAAPEALVLQRMNLENDAKDLIAHAAAEMIPDGDSIFIGPGSTTACLARCLAQGRRLTVVTNALNVAMAFSAVAGEMTVVLVGGVLLREELALLGHIAEQALSEVRVSKIFMSVQAVNSENGWTSDCLAEVATTRRILTMAQDLVILADHTKLGRTAAALIAPVSRLTTLVTDRQADAWLVQQFQRQGVQVILV